MNKKILMVITAIMMAFGVLAVIPAQETKAATNTYALGFEEAITYWSQQPLFDQIYALEVNKADYAQVTKDNKRDYFKASLVDYVMRPASVSGPRPLTYNFMRDMLALSNPNFADIIRGCGPQNSLRNILEGEVNYFAPMAPASDKENMISYLTGCLNNARVYNEADYKNWRGLHGGRSAFEVFIGAYKYACTPCPGYGYWWNGWTWCAPVKAVVSYVGYVNYVNESIVNCIANEVVATSNIMDAQADAFNQAQVQQAAAMEAAVQAAAMPW